MQVLSPPQVSVGLPPSPTLTNPDMILPFDAPSSGDTSPPVPQKDQLPPSPMEDDRRARSSTAENHSKLKHAKQSLSPFRNGVLTPNDGAILRSNSQRSHGRIKVENSRLSFRPDGEVTMGPSHSPHGSGDATGMAPLPESPDEEDGAPNNIYKTPSILDEDENDPESHAAMTRRAEEILANAKKRLNNMEGNLNRARSTLGSRPSSSMSSFTDREAPYQREKFSRLKHRQVNLALKQDHQGHSRVFSETSVPSSLQSPTKASAQSANGDRSSETDRPWFWNGLSRSTSIADKHNPGLQPLDEDGALDSFERQAIQEEDEELQGQMVERQADSAGSGPEISPTYGLSRSRSTNQMRDLRDQMTDLKGKISTLKQRAREDSLRRRSLQSLRTPSPLTNAEQDYANVPLAESQNRGSGLDGVPQKGAPSPKITSVESKAIPQTPPMLADEVIPSQDKQSPGKDSGVDFSDNRISEKVDSKDPLAVPDHGNGMITQAGEKLAVQEIQEPVINDEIHLISGAVDDNTKLAKESESHIEREMNGESEISEKFEEPVGERHEDRADAFDYEHFFLHSSMGHYGRKRSSTHSSTYSTETERPPTMVLDSSIEERNESPNKHVRQNSNSSVSTMATFATATEGEGEEIQDDSETEWTPRQTMAGTWLVDPPTVEVNGDSKKYEKARSRRNPDTKQEKSAKRHRREHSVTDDGVNAPVAEMPDLMTYLRAMLSKDAGSQIGLTLNDSDKELAERVMKSLAYVCLDLQNFAEDGGKYEARVCRRKLDTARRHLDGEVNGEAF